MLSALTRRQDISTVIRDSSESDGLRKILSVRDLVSFGISSTLGSGIFVTVGTIATMYSGPGLFLTFIVAGLGSLLSAYCYAEFASRLPVSGQSYTYTYVSLGELVAFITGWLGFLSYAVSTAAVARGWASYLDCFVTGVTGITMPRWLVNDPIEGYEGILSLCGLAVGVNFFCTILGCFGIHESTRISFILVVINCTLMIVFSVFGSLRYGSIENLEPLLPFGILGVLRGSGLAFFCCIGWELVCTLSEEVRHPSRDLPRGIIGSLGIVTILYCGVCLSLSLMVPYESISISAPIADAFKYHGDRYGYLLISFVCTTVCPPSILTGLVGPPRILYKMAKDGLLYEKFGILNAHKSPVWATIFGGIVAGILGGIFEFESLVSSCSCVTLFMFVIVCVGVITVRIREASIDSGFFVARTDNTLGSRTRGLWLSIGGFCLVSFLFSVALIEDGVEGYTINILAFINIVLAAVVIRLYQNIIREMKTPTTTPVSAKKEPLLAHASIDMIVVTSVSSRNRKREIFLCPGVPFLPLLAAWVNIFMMASLGVPALGGLVIMLACGLPIYFTYGIYHSNLIKDGK
jgi:APA family basic amino acid/polyamine antiporter